MLDELLRWSDALSVREENEEVREWTKRPREATASRGRSSFRIPASPHSRQFRSNTCVYPFTTSVSTLFVTEPWYVSPVWLDSKSSEPLSFV